MITKKTVFILGAGASMPYGFPSGAKLLADIANDLKKQLDEQVARGGAVSPEHGKELVQRAKLLRNKIIIEKHESIDLLVSRNPSFEEIAKCAIAINILKAEACSDFVASNVEDWYTLIARKLTEKITSARDIARYADNAVTFVTFNYDRSLEHRLYEYLSSFIEGVPGDTILNLYRSVPIYHVYGKLADLPWEDSAECVKYGAEFSFSTMDRISRRFDLIYDNRRSEFYADIRRAIIKAERVCFLGFGYHELNLSSLGLVDLFSKARPEILGTGLGLKDFQIAKLKGQFTFPSEAIGEANNVDIRPVNCFELLDNWADL